jgi:hypothetical protein
MSSLPKYRAQPVFWDEKQQRIPSQDQLVGIKTLGEKAIKDSFLRFDSTLEFNVYLKLVDLVGSKRILRQYPLEVLPPGYCYLTGKKWRVDFAILERIGDKFPISYVEAKGLITTDFSYALACLEVYNPDSFDQLSLVFGQRFPPGKLMTRLRKTDFAKRIYTLKQFQCISRLK